MQWVGSYFGTQKSWKTKSNKFILSIFALLQWIRKPGTQTMTKMEGYQITDPSALRMKLCVFACCSATKVQCLLPLKMVIFLRKEKKPLCRGADTTANPPPVPFVVPSPTSSWWKMCKNKFMWTVEIMAFGHLLVFWQMKVVAPKEMVKGSRLYFTKCHYFCVVTST